MPEFDNNVCASMIVAYFFPCSFNVSKSQLDEDTNDWCKHKCCIIPACIGDICCVWSTCCFCCYCCSCPLMN